jgi:hypothetical protein
MGIISQAADTYYTYRMIRTLVTDWKDQEAYQYGIIDEKGKVLRKASTLKTSDEKSSYTLFHRLTFNLKRILESLPMGTSKLASYAAALFLLKEETNLSEEQLKEILDRVIGNIESDNEINEGFWNTQEDGCLSPGIYTLNEDIAAPSTGEIIAKKGTQVIVPGLCEAVDTIFGTPIYKVKHTSTKTDVYITPKGLAR